MTKKISRLLALLLAALLALSACSRNGDNATPPPDQPQNTEPPVFTVTACVSQAQNSLDPALNTADGGETILFHLFENLMRWENDGDGFAALAPGQAESYSVETDYAGNATYTFLLREGIRWSDGENVTAQDFVYSWQRLANPATNSPHSELLRMVSGYDQVQATGDVSLLGVSAPDERTFVVSLSGSCAWFLEEVCAGAYTSPVRESQSAGSAITNGAYTVKSFGNSSVVLEKSSTYYNRRAVHAEILQFITSADPESDYQAFLDGETDLMWNLPASALSISSDAANWLVGSASASYGVLINAAYPPFDDIAIRQAFQLAIDPTAVVPALGDATLTPAAGLVPFGVSDYGPRPPREEETNVLPDPNAAPVEEEPAIYWDFRAHSSQLLTHWEESDYEANCQRARALMGQAGYAEGGGFPVVEYIYEESDANRAAALALQAMWQEQLGVTVTVRGLSSEEYAAAMAGPAEEGGTAAFQMAGIMLTADYSDAEPFLSLWHGSNSAVTGYQSSAFDILLNSAGASADPTARDAYLHDAEAILLGDAAVIPLYFRGISYQLSSSLTGLYTGPDGVFFLCGLEEWSADR